MTTSTPNVAPDQAWIEHARGDHRASDRGPQASCLHCVEVTSTRP